MQAINTRFATKITAFEQREKKATDVKQLPAGYWTERMWNTHTAIETISTQLSGDIIT